MSLDRPRDAGDGSEEKAPEILRCPVEGCDRTIIGDVTGLKNHVRNLEDDLHRGKVLTADLKVVDQSRESEHPIQGTPPSEIRIKSAAECTW